MKRQSRIFLFFSVLIGLLWQLSAAQQIVWERQVQCVLDGVEMGFYHGGMEYTKPTLADLDGDGDGDLYIGEHDGYLNYFENLGGDPPNWLCVTTSLDSIDVGKHCAPVFWDKDEDGDLDLFMGSEDGVLWYYRNDGTTSAPIWVFQTAAYDSIQVDHHAIPAFADLDADGDDDLLVAHNNGGAAYFMNVGAASAPIWRYQTEFYQGIDLGDKSTVCVCDLDADSLSDLVMSYLEGDIHYFHNEGPPQAPVFSSQGVIASVYKNGAPTLWDLDGDGDKDLISGLCEGNLNVWWNVGSASVPAWERAFTQFGYFDVGYYSQPALADIDADGDLDLFIGRNRFGLCFLENVGTPDSAAWHLVNENYANINLDGKDAPAFGDIDYDGDFDMVVGCNDGTLTFYENIGTPQVPAWDAPVYNYTDVDVGENSAPTFANIDGDADIDLFVGSYLGDLRFIRNDGSLTNPSWHDLGNFPNVGGEFFSVPCFTDMDGDGDSDLLMGSGNLTGFLSYYQNVGTPYMPYWSLASRPYMEWDFGDHAAPCCGDLDNDGDDDLLTGCAAGGLYYFENTGVAFNVAIFLTPYGTPIQIPAEGGRFSFNIGLFNYESNPVSFDAWVLLQRPNGTWTDPIVGPCYVTIPGNSVFNRYRLQEIPGSAEPGTYLCEAYIGDFPDEIWNSNNFSFEKLTTFAGGEWVENWANSGDPLENWFSSNEAGIMLPKSFALHQNYPNPFNPMTTIAFELPYAATVQLSVYDVSGRQVAELVNGCRDAGRHELVFDAAHLSSGVYFFRLHAENYCAEGKMLLLK
ncbi:MAG: T9SS type A sorting domain-containing protein [bacterium]